MAYTQNDTKKTRMKQKCDTPSAWESAATKSNFTPFEGEIIVYKAATTTDKVHKNASKSYTVPTPTQIKVGNGVQNVTDLPFVTGGVQIWTWEEGDI